MNREIKFRGKRVDNGQWVYGNINYLHDGVFILENDQSGGFIEADYHSSGMGCGLEDRNIRDRYEAMQHGWERAIEKQSECFPLFLQVHPETVGQLLGWGVYDGDIIDVGDGKARAAKYDEIECVVTLTPHYDARSFGELGVRERLNVIGNIHDNNELIK